MNRITNSSNHDLWVYGKDGYVFQYNELQDTFKLDFDFYAQFPHLKQSPITATYFDSSDRLWFCCGNRIVRFYTDTQRFETVYEKSPTRLPASLKEIHPFSIFLPFQTFIRYSSIRISPVW